MTQAQTQNLDPEYLDAHGVFQKFGLKRGLLYVLIEQNLIESVSTGRDGKRGKRLFKVSSIREFLSEGQFRK